MAEQEYMHHFSDSLETGDPGEGRNAVSMEKLESHFSQLEDCTKAVQADMSSCKFNTHQCGYLADKLKVVVQRARSYSYLAVCSCGDATKWVEVLKLLLTLGKQIESFVRSCCKHKWIQAAVTLTNVSEYVSSLGFNVELCGIAISKVYAGDTRGLHMDELDNMNKTEVEIVKLKASSDFENLFESVKKDRDSSTGEKRQLANYLCQKLAGEEPSATSASGQSFWRNLFDWRKPGKQLGRGASAAVEEVTWLGISVAKKTFDGEDNPDFLKEVEIVRQLCHSNIMSMFCFAKDMRSCSIIMELMDGDLHTLIRRRCENNDSPPFPILEAVSIMLQIGEGVNYLHNNGFVHRDLKSKNILVKSLKVESRMEHVVHAKVADFGISKASKRDLTFSNQTFNMGTCKWMPPEIINTLGIAKGPLGNDNEPNYPFKCDTYSFGMVCYEILSGYEPFGYEKETYPRTIKDRIIRGERPKLPPNCPCPPMLKALIERCWRKEPKERPRFDFICLQLKSLKFLLMIGAGADEEAHGSAVKELEAAAISARKEEEEREQEAAAKRRAETALVEEEQSNDALSPLEQEARDARARERESELEAAASNEALEQKAAAKSRVKAALLVSLREGLHVVRPTQEQIVTAREKIQYQPNKVHIAVCGTSGSGKSSLINAFRGLRPRDACAARVGATETTSKITRYPDPRSGLPYSRYVWYDIPGAGTTAVSDGQYFETQALFVFDLIILVYGERFTNTDVDIIQKCIRLGISIIIVRSKSDQHIENMIRDETDLSPGDDEYEQIYQEIKSKYIDATKSEFNMHKKAMAEVLFDDKPWLQEVLLHQRVYMVCAANVRSLMQTLVQTGVKKGEGVNKSKIIDENLLIEDVLRAAMKPIFDFKVGLCCDSCVRKVRKQIETVRGVESVRVDLFRNEVTVIGNVDPEIVLRTLRKVRMKAELVEGGGMREMEEGPGRARAEDRNDNNSNNANNNNRG